MKRGALGLVVGSLALVVAIGLAVWMLQTRSTGEQTTAPRAEAPAPEGTPPSFADANAAARPIAAAESPPGSAEPTPASDVAAVASSLRVTVLDERHVPIAGAHVTVKTQWRTPLVTDADGLAVVTAPPGSEVDVMARHPDFRFQLLHATMPASGAPAGEATIVLSKGLTACVHIEDDRGQPLAGAEVFFRELEHKGINILGSFVGTLDEYQSYLINDQFDNTFAETRSSAADGSCCVQGTRAGILTVSVRAEGFVYVNQRDFDLGPRGGDLGTISLQRARTLEGTVVDTAGPVPGARVESLWGGRDSNRRWETQTDEVGRFSFSSLTPDANHFPLRVSHPTRGDYYEDRVEYTGDPLLITLRPSLDVTVRLRDSSTHVLLQGPCTITRQLEFLSLLLPWREPKGGQLENGEYHVGWLPYYALGLQIEVPGYARAVLDMPAIQSAVGAPVEVDLVRAGTIAVHVLDGSTGQPLADVRIEASRLDPNRIGSYWHVEAPWDDGAGAWILDTSQFSFTPGADEAFYVGAPDHKGSGPITVSANGVRVCGPTVDVTLQPK